MFLHKNLLAGVITLYGKKTAWQSFYTDYTHVSKTILQAWNTLSPIVQGFEGIFMV